MGRIGRLLFRRLIEDENFEVAAVNDLMPEKNLAYLLKYDSVYGTFCDEVKANEQALIVNGKEIKAFRESDPASLPWKALEVDVVLECTGKFITKEGASKHLQAGAKKVLLSTTGSDDIPLGIFGHNHNGNSGNIDILSPGGCMTNCSVHVLYVLNTIGIQSVHLNILHSYTSRQALVDMPNDQFRRGRAAAESIIPVVIDLHKSLIRLMPALKNKINVFSTRIPVANGAMASFSVQLKEEVTTDQLNKMFQKTAKNNYQGIMDFTEEPLVSLDIKSNSHSCIIDGTQTSAIGNHVRVVAWFDNEFGFTSRMIDWLNYWNKK